MNAVIIWILVVISDGGYSRGNTSTIGNFETHASCHSAAEQIGRASRDVIPVCIETTNLITEGDTK